MAIEVLREMAEGLFAHRGEKGDIGPQGPAGTPTLDSAMKLLNMQLIGSYDMDQTFNIHTCKNSGWCGSARFDTTGTSTPMVVADLTLRLSSSTTGLIYAGLARESTGNGYPSITKSIAEWIGYKDPPLTQHYKGLLTPGSSQLDIFGVGVSIFNIPEARTLRVYGTYSVYTS